MALFLLVFASSIIFQDKDDFKTLTPLLSSCFSFKAVSTTYSINPLHGLDIYSLPAS